MPNVGPLEIAVVLIIVLIIFGPKRLPELGQSMGRGIREFKSSLSGDKDKDSPEEKRRELEASQQAQPTQPQPAQPVADQTPPPAQQPPAQQPPAQQPPAQQPAADQPKAPEQPAETVEGEVVTEHKS
jgi:TatA/E family protein of Tat protein translocase